jgi:transcriptional regulator with XRE-family HTH domain
MIDDELNPDPYSRKVGERLRAIRRQKRLSLQEVEAKSHQEFKASVLGAYERGERSISVPRLQRLARFYTVPVDQLLPVDEGPDFGIDTSSVIDLTDRPARHYNTPVTIDLTKLEALRGPEAEMLARYLTMVQVKRQDFNGRMLTVRRDDHQALAAILGVGVDAAGSRLDDLGLSYRVPECVVLRPTHCPQNPFCLRFVFRFVLRWAAGQRMVRWPPSTFQACPVIQAPWSLHR